jgi:hypothetical protein
MMTSVAPAANKEMDPLLPAGTMAALATTCPANEFNVETTGWGVPVGHAVK